MNKIIAIVATSSNRVIGVNNTIPWKIKEDMAWFRDHTWGHPVIMGRKTYESISNKLPGRHEIVVSRSIQGKNSAKSIEEAIGMARTKPLYTGGFKPEDRVLDNMPDKPDIFIAGGGEIYAQTIHLWDYLYITVVNKEMQGDTFFPNYENRMRLVDTVVKKEDYRIEVWSKM